MKSLLFHEIIDEKKAKFFIVSKVDTKIVVFFVNLDIEQFPIILKAEVNNSDFVNSWHELYSISDEGKNVMNHSIKIDINHRDISVTEFLEKYLYMGGAKVQNLKPYSHLFVPETGSRWYHLKVMYITQDDNGNGTVLLFNSDFDRNHRDVGLMIGDLNANEKEICKSFFNMVDKFSINHITSKLSAALIDYFDYRLLKEKYIINSNGYKDHSDEQVRHWINEQFSKVTVMFSKVLE